MSQRFVSFPVVKRSFFLFMILCATLLVSWTAVQAAIPDSQDILLQYSAAGHVLGFASDGFYVAGGDHLFHVGFVGASGVKPEAENGHHAEEKNSPLSGVDYHDLWPGIHLHYAVTQKGIAESAWEIIPGAHVNQIRLRYNAPVTIGIDGNLNIKYPTGTMKESAPVAWQEIDGHRCPVKVAFSLFASSAKASVLGFKVGQYDSSRPLLIDPTLSWNTFMGSGGYDTGNAMALDSQGNIYVVGYGINTISSAAGMDAFVAKFDSNGNLVWNTFLGSPQFDGANAVAVDDHGNIFMAGESLATWGSPKQGYTGGRDGFVAKLNSIGHLSWNTFMGSSGDDFAQGIAVDSSGNVDVTGYSESSWGNPKRPYTGGWDAFAAKLDATNGILTWNTFLGSIDPDYGKGIAVDGNGAVYVAGYSEKSWGNNPVRGFTGSTFEAFAAKLDSAGVLQWNTFLGSSGVDVAEGIALDKTNNIYIIGSSSATWENPINNFTGGAGDVFVAKLHNNGGLQWNTFLGSTGNDVGQAITLDSQGSIYVAGRSDAAWGNGKQTYAGGKDAFAAKLTKDGILKWNTFLGSLDDDEGHGITAGNGGSVYITGISESTWGAPKNSHSSGSNSDAFAAKLRPNCSFYIFRSKNGKTTAVCL